MEDKLASKQDLQDLRIEVQQTKIELQHSIAEVKSELQFEIRQSITQLESKLTFRMGTMLAASIAIITAIQKLL